MPSNQPGQAGNKDVKWQIIPQLQYFQNLKLIALLTVDAEMRQAWEPRQIRWDTPEHVLIKAQLLQMLQAARDLEHNQAHCCQAQDD